MAIETGLLTLSRTYPIISFAIAFVLFIIGLIVAKKLFKWIVWGFAVLSIILAFVMMFY